MDEREIFERYAERVLQFFINKVDSPSDANDLAQESFIRVFERLRRGDVRHPRAFLFGVAALVLKEHWKAKGRQPADLDPGTRSVVEMGGAKTSLCSLFARRQGHRRMLDAMRSLRLDYQNVLELRYWHDLKYDEIAEILGQNEKTVGVWLRRAKQSLRQALEHLTQSDEPGEPFEPLALDQWLRDAGRPARRAAADRASPGPAA